MLGMKGCRVNLPNWWHYQIGCATGRSGRARALALAGIFALAALAGRAFDTTVPILSPGDNVFVNEPVTTNALPEASAWERDVPVVFWDGHDDVAEMFAAAWKMVGAKLHRPEPKTNFKRNFVYTPFGRSVFVWGSCFIAQYGEYAAHVFPFIEQLDNFYAVQGLDGFIPRQLGIYDGVTQFAPSDLSSVGGVIFAWTELGHYRRTGDASRLAKVYPVLLAHHRWYRTNRTWKDGTYFSSGWGCGMDNIPRSDEPNFNAAFMHGHLSYVDVTLQQIFDAKNLLEIARALRLPEEPDLRGEITNLNAIANTRMWNSETGLYHDLDRSGRPAACEHIGGFWSLLAGVADRPKVAAMVRALEDPAHFAAPCGTRSLSKSAKGYQPDGGNYWQGGVWAITDYMIAKGLDTVGETDAAHRLARRQVEAFARVFRETGTIWESYDPEGYAPGKCYGETVRRDFVGFSGVTPIALLLEDVFGIRVGPDAVEVQPRMRRGHYGVRNLTLPSGRRVDVDVTDGRVDIARRLP